MEPNPIFWLELRRLRRGPWPYFLFVAGLTMCGLLFWLGADNTRSYTVWHTPLLWAPIMFHVAALFGIPYNRTITFANQQISEDLILQTPMNRSDVYFGKLNTGIVLVVLAYLPVTPGVTFFLGHNRWEYPMFFWLSFVTSLCLLPVFFCFAIEVKSAAGVVGRFALLFVFLVAGLILFWLCYGAFVMVIHDLIDFSNGSVFLVCLAHVYLFSIAGLTTWLGVVLFDPKKEKDGITAFLSISAVALFAVLSLVYATGFGEFSGHVIGFLLFILVCFFGPLYALMSRTNAKDFARKHLFP